MLMLVVRFLGRLDLHILGVLHTNLQATGPWHYRHRPCLHADRRVSLVLPVTRLPQFDSECQSWAIF